MVLAREIVIWNEVIYIYIYIYIYDFKKKKDSKLLVWVHTVTYRQREYNEKKLDFEGWVFWGLSGSNKSK